MEQVRTTLGDSGLILALDEFEAIEEAVRGQSGRRNLPVPARQDPGTVDYGGLRRPAHPRRNEPRYAQPFYGSYQNIVVSYLAPEDACHLITNPTPDFTVNYEPAAVDASSLRPAGSPICCSWSAAMRSIISITSCLTSTRSVR